MISPNESGASTRPSFDKRTARIGLRFTRLALMGALALATAVHAVAPASADEQKALEAEAKALVATLTGHQKSKAAAAAHQPLMQLAEIHNSLSSKSARHALQHIAGKILTDEKMGAARIAAAGILARLDDPAGAYKHLKPALPGAKTEKAQPAELAALKAVGVLAPDRAIPELLELMRKGKDNAVSGAAIVALGAFGTSKERIAVLEKMVAHLRLIKPRYAPGKRVGAATRARWNAVRNPLIGSLNRLTGQDVSSADEWLELFKTHKKRPKALFIQKD